MPRLAESNQEKLKLEIKLLRQQLKEDAELKNRSKLKLFWDYFLKTLPTWLVFLSIITAIVALYTQSYSFLEERKKDNKILVNEEMFEYLDAIKEGKFDYEIDQLFLLLTQYENDALPIFLHLVEYQKINDETEFQRALKGIQTILIQTEDKDEVFENILQIIDIKIRTENESNLEEKSAYLIFYITLIEKIDYNCKCIANSYLENWSEYLRSKIDTCANNTNPCTNNDNSQNKSNICNLILKIECFKQSIPKDFFCLFH